MKILVYSTLLTLCSLSLAAEPEYFKKQVKGVGYIDAFSRATFTFNPGTLEGCNPSTGGFSCNIKDGNITFEQGTSQITVAFTGVNIYISKDAKYPELPDGSYAFRGTYSDNLLATDQKIATTVTMGTKGGLISGLLTRFDGIYGTPIAQIKFFGSTK